MVLVNSNPATIMTDKHLADEIYLEPLTEATLRRIIEKERPDGLLAGLGGQTALTLAMQLSRDGTLAKYGVRLLGSDIEAIERAEDREKFRETMKAIGQPVVASEIAVTLDEAIRAAQYIGYPVIVRPAYTLAGTGGGIAGDETSLRQIAAQGLELSPIHQVLIERCISGWKEIEFETMRDAQGNVIPRKSGVKPGTKRKDINQDGTPRKKPGVKPGTKRGMYNKDGSLRKKPGPKSKTGN